MNKERKLIVIELADGIKLIAEQNVDPYEDEITVYLDKKDSIQDLVMVSLSDTFDDNANRVPSTENISIKVFADSNNEDFTDEYTIPIEA